MKSKNKKNSDSGLSWQKLKPKVVPASFDYSCFKKEDGMIGRVGLLLVALGLFGVGFAWMEKVVHQDSGPVDLTSSGHFDKAN